MSTYAKFPTQPGAGVAPTSFVPVFAGLGTGTYALNTAMYSVSNGMLTLIVKVTMTADGTGLSPFTLQIPGGYSYDTALIPSADVIVGSLSTGISVTFASPTTLQFNAINGFATGVPYVGADLSNGEIYSLRAVFPVTL